MPEIKEQGGPGVGIFWKSTYATVWNRTGATLTVGEVIMADLTDVDAGTTTSLVEGNDGSVYANFISPSTAGIGVVTASASTGHPGFFFGVVVDLLPQQGQTAGGDDTKVKVQLQGVAKISMVATAITVGLPLFPANGVRTLTPVVAAGVKVLAIAHEPNGSAAGVYQCLFDGINGFPAVYAS